MSSVRPSRHGADLDPDIQRFITTLAAGYAGHPPLDQLSHAAARAVAERVRQPWRAGGPTMLRTEETHAPSPHGPVRVRIYDPSPATPKPALVYVHGGGWTLFSLDTHDRVMREYAARADVVVIGVDYALSPEARFPVALEQVVAVIRWLGDTGPKFGIDPERLAVGGDSAGGNMSFAAAMMLRDAGEAWRCAALLLSYAVFDDDSSAYYHDRFGGAGYMLTSGEMAGFWAGYLQGPADRGNPLAVPMRGEVAGLPPVFLTIPECDLLAGQSLAMAARLEAAGTPVEARVYAGASHSFLEAVSIAPLAGQALQDGADWLRAQLRG